MVNDILYKINVKRLKSNPRIKFLYDYNKINKILMFRSNNLIN